MNTRFKLLAVTTVIVLATATTASADNLTIDWWTIDGGGEMWTAGGNFELSGTIGQPDAG